MRRTPRSAMYLDELRDHCLAQRGAWEDQPFGPDVLVFKVGKKMFGMLSLDRMPYGIGLKCDPERALRLRERYSGVSTGPYMHTAHWNLVQLDADVPSSRIRELVEHSHALVVAGMTKAARAELDAAFPPEAPGA